jgi:hypothetical protein
MVVLCAIEPHCFLFLLIEITFIFLIVLKLVMSCTLPYLHVNSVKLFEHATSFADWEGEAWDVRGSVCMCVSVSVTPRHQARLERTQKLHYLHFSSEKKGTLCGLCDGCNYGWASRLETMRQIITSRSSSLETCPPLCARAALRSWRKAMTSKWGYIHWDMRNWAPLLPQ